MQDLNKSKKIESAPEQPASEQLSRRETTKKLVKMAYVVPAVLAVVKATERPAFPQSGPLPAPQ